MKTRVLIVDDHQLFRDTLKTIISCEDDMEVVGTAENGRQAVALARELVPDVILMDAKMPVMDGAEATRQILAELPGMKIWALSVYCSEVFVLNMIRAGAAGYIPKGCDLEILYDAIRKAKTPETHWVSECPN